MDGTFGAYAASTFGQYAVEFFGSEQQSAAYCRRLSVAQAAYLAGIMDGEGQVALRRIKGTGGIYVEIAVTNSHLPVLEWVVATTGLGHTVVHRAEGYGGHAWKQTWLWRISAARAASVLAAIRPYLIIKAERADLALDTQGRLLWPSLRRDRTWREDAFQRMKALNRQGRDTAEASASTALPVPIRVMRGAARTNAVLTDESVRAIRTAYAAGGVSQGNLAKRHGVSQATIYAVVHRISWTHVD